MTSRSESCRTGVLRARTDLPTRALFLVGFMGSGKSSVGMALSQRLGWRFQDLDELIEAREGRTIAAIFEESGETAFRRAERAALIELLEDLSLAPTVAALGGGASVQSENAELLERSGAPMVFLDAPVEQLWQRCQDETRVRPLMQNQHQFRQLYEARRPLYMKAALRIDITGKDVRTIAAEVASQLCLDHDGKEK